MGESRCKALSVVEPHKELESLETHHPLRRLIENPNRVDTHCDEGLRFVGLDMMRENRCSPPVSSVIVPVKKTTHT
jgi:hypothetical protein